LRIRPATGQRDLDLCCKLDHSFETDQVYQMDSWDHSGTIQVTFRRIRLPREVEVSYPLQGDALRASWQYLDGFLVAVDQSGINGYFSFRTEPEHSLVSGCDLVVDRSSRRQGIGSALLWAAEQWSRERGFRRLVIGGQTKNDPFVQFCRACGLSFCGYNDHYWPSQDIALFFGKTLR